VGSGCLHAGAEDSGLCLGVVEAKKYLFGEAAEVLEFGIEVVGAKVVVANGLAYQPDAGGAFSIGAEAGEGSKQWHCVVFWEMG